MKTAASRRVTPFLACSVLGLFLLLVALLSPVLAGTKLSIIGSESMRPLVEILAAQIQKKHPGLKIELGGKGSGTGARALIAQTAQVASMSRRMKGGEVKAFTAAHGYGPTEIRLALDFLDVWVNKENPIECLSRADLRAIFSSDSPPTWGEFGVAGPLAGEPMKILTRTKASGTRFAFGKMIFDGQDFGNAAIALSQNDIAHVVAQDVAAIGYGPGNRREKGMHPVPIATEKGGKCASPDYADAGHSYPLARFIYLYFDLPPGEPINEVIVDLLHHVWSVDGMRDIRDAGYWPVPASVQRMDREKLYTKVE